MSAPRRVLFYVQHLLGIGHIRRASLIVKAMSAAGLDVTLVSGGEPLETMDIGMARLVQLAPVKSGDARFSVLVDEHGKPVDDAWKAARRARLGNRRRWRRRVPLASSCAPARCGRQGWRPS